VSSHHIVRDEQEPALFILDLEGVAQELLGHLLEWSPTVITISSQVEQCLMSGFRIDVVLCNAKEADDLKAGLQHQLPVRFLTAPDPEQYIYNGLSFLHSIKHKAVNIIAPFSTSLMDVVSDFPSQMTIAIYDQVCKWHRVYKHFRKWVPRDQSFRVTSGSCTIKGNTTPVLKAPDDHYGFFSINEGFIEIDASDPFWFGENVISP